jgi:hypothetical protein
MLIYPGTACSGNPQCTTIDVYNTLAGSWIAKFKLKVKSIPVSMHDYVDPTEVSVEIVGLQVQNQTFKLQKDTNSFVKPFTEILGWFGTSNPYFFGRFSLYQDS